VGGPKAKKTMSSGKVESKQGEEHQMIEVPRGESGRLESRDMHQRRHAYGIVIDRPPSDCSTDTSCVPSESWCSPVPVYGLLLDGSLIF